MSQSKTQPRVLLITADADYARLLKDSFEQRGFALNVYLNASDALHSIYEPDSTLLAAYPWLILIETNLADARQNTWTEKFFRASPRHRMFIFIINSPDCQAEQTPAWRELRVNIVFPQMPADDRAARLIFAASNWFWGKYNS